MTVVKLAGAVNGAALDNLVWGLMLIIFALIFGADFWPAVVDWLFGRTGKRKRTRLN